MKVKDILKELKNVDPETEVVFALLEGCCGNTEVLDGELDVCQFSSDKTWSVRFEFGQLRGYESCIRAGKMHKLAEKLSGDDDE